MSTRKRAIPRSEGRLERRGSSTKLWIQRSSRMNHRSWRPRWSSSATRTSSELTPRRGSEPTRATSSRRSRRGRPKIRQPESLSTAESWPRRSSPRMFRSMTAGMRVTPRSLLPSPPPSRTPRTRRQPTREPQRTRPRQRAGRRTHSASTRCSASSAPAPRRTRVCQG